LIKKIKYLNFRGGKNRERKGVKGKNRERKARKGKKGREK